jgi:hypothetical protein
MSTDQEYFRKQALTVQRDRVVMIATPLGDIKLELPPPEKGGNRKIIVTSPPLMGAYKNPTKRPGEDKVPMLVRWDGELKKNIVVKDFVQLQKGIDGELVGLEKPAPIVIKTGGQV